MKSKNTEPPSPERLYQYALRLLTARDYSAARLCQKLVAWGGSRERAEELVTRLQSEGLVDDRRYAGRFVESALASGRYVGSRLRLELRRRGIDAALAGEVLRQESAGLDEEAELRRLVDKRWPDFAYGAADDRERRRVAAFLQRRGFAPTLVMRVLRSREEF